MKKVTVLFLAFVMIVGLCACGTNGEVSPNTTSGSTQQQKAQSSSSKPSIPSAGNAKAFESNQDLKIIAAFGYNNRTYVIVENIGDQAVLNCRVAYMGFDKNGFVATKDSDGYKKGQADTVNLMPKEKDILAWYGAEGEYIVATVIGVDYADGTTWETTQIETWAESVRKNFSVEEHKVFLNKMQENGVLAEKCEYATLSNLQIKHGNPYSNNQDFHFALTNKSKLGIQRVNMFVLEFDKSGFPVSVSPYDTYCVNGHQTGGIVNLAGGQSDQYSDDLFLSATTSQIKAVISFIELQDGTTWENPYIYEWILANSSSY